MNFQLKYVCKDDLSQLYELYKHLAPSTKEYDVNEYEATWYSMQRNTVIIGAFVETKLIAAVSFIIEDKLIRDCSRVGYLEDLVVEPFYRNEGVGSSLIESVIDLARMNRCYKLLLHCDTRHCELYEREGFYKKDEGMRIDLI